MVEGKETRLSGVLGRGFVPRGKVDAEKNEESTGTRLWCQPRTVEEWESGRLVDTNERKRKQMIRKDLLGEIYTTDLGDEYERFQSTQKL